MSEITEYIESLKLGNKSDHTIRSYTKDIQKLYTFFNVSNIDDLNKLTEKDFKTFYNSQNLKPESINGLIRNLKAYFSWLLITKKISKEHEFFNVAFGGSKFISVHRTSKVVLTKEESVSLIKSGKDVQTKFMLALMLTTALRAGEVSKIKLTDISECHIKIHGKGGDERKTKLDETLCQMLNIYLAEERDTDSPYLFYGRHGEESNNGRLSETSINLRVKRCAERCITDGSISEEKGTKITAHRLRGTAITEVAIEFGLLAAQRFAGHKNSNTTLLYINDGDRITENVIDSRSGMFAGIMSNHNQN